MNAIISDCQKYRYMLERHVSDSGNGTVLFIMLNPSTADHNIDDPTIRRCCSFAKKFGLSTLRVINLFSYRATNPHELTVINDPYGPDNRRHQIQEIQTADLIICAWGAKGSLFSADKKMYELLSHHKKDVHALEFTKTGHPKHPLYIRGDATLLPIGLPSL